MIGIVLMYFVGKSFYDLAGLHNRSQWGFAILGVASYYVGSFLGGLLLAVLSEFGLFSLDGLSDISLGVMALPMAILSCWGFYTILKSQWRKKVEKVSSEQILDSDLVNNNSNNM